MKPSMPRTVADLMAVTGLSKNSVYAAIKTGQLPGYHIGKRVVIPGEAFEAFCRGEWQPAPKPMAPIRPLIVTKGRAA